MFLEKHWLNFRKSFIINPDEICEHSNFQIICGRFFLKYLFFSDSDDSSGTVDPRTEKGSILK